MSDMVNHPDHYISESGLEVIDVIDAFTENLYGREAAYTANIIKYICRWKAKNGLEDLKKAQWYLNRLIEFVDRDDKGEEPIENVLYEMFGEMFYDILDKYIIDDQTEEESK